MEWVRLDSDIRPNEDNGLYVLINENEIRGADVVGYCPIIGFYEPYYCEQAYMEGYTHWSKLDTPNREEE